MLLCLDIGNTSISLGLFDRAAADASERRPTPLLTAKLSSDMGRTADEYAIILRGLLCERTSEITEVAMGSVVPQLTHTLEAAVRKTVGREPLPVLHIGGGVRTGISLRVDDPGALGADIVANAAAAANLYGTPVVFFDYGTATVCGAVNAARELVGVSIAPGLYTSLTALRATAARLPYLELQPPADRHTADSVLGKNTADAIRAGVVTGAALMTDGMLDSLHAEFGLPAGTPLRAVVTGGLAELVLPACRCDLVHEPHLTLIGLAIIYRATVERKRK